MFSHFEGVKMEYRMRMSIMNGLINSLEKTKWYSSTEQQPNSFEERHCLREITQNPEMNTRQRRNKPMPIRFACLWRNRSSFNTMYCIYTPSCNWDREYLLAACIWGKKAFNEIHRVYRENPKRNGMKMNRPSSHTFHTNIDRTEKIVCSVKWPKRKQNQSHSSDSPCLFCWVVFFLCEWVNLLWSIHLALYRGWIAWTPAPWTWISDTRL